MKTAQQWREELVERGSSGEKCYTILSDLEALEGQVETYGDAYRNAMGLVWELEGELARCRNVVDELRELKDFYRDELKACDAKINRSQT